MQLNRIRRDGGEFSGTCKRWMHDTGSFVIASVSEAIQLWRASQQAGWLGRKELLAMTGPPTWPQFQERRIERTRLSTRSDPGKDSADYYGTMDLRAAKR